MTMMESSPLVALKEYCVENRLKELQESLDRYAGHQDTTEILLKTMSNTKQSISLFFTGVPLYKTLQTPT